MPSTLCLITGATGFIGQALQRYLQEQGMSVRALTRDASRAAQTADSAVEWVVGDITQPATLVKAMAGVECVFHLAGYAHAWEEQDAEFAARHQAVNEQGTLNVLQAAQAAGVKRLVFFSTIKAVADADHCTDETASAWPTTAYGIAKRQAEEQVLVRCQDGPTQAVVLRLSLVYGVGWKGNLAAMLKWIDRGLLPPLPPLSNQKSMISVQDVCRAAYLAATVSLTGSHRIILTDGERYSTTRIDRAMRTALGRKPPRWYLPLSAWWTLAWLGSIGQWVLRRRLPINRQALHKLFDNSCYRSLYAQSVLGFVPRDTLESTLPEIIAK